MKTIKKPFAHYLFKNWLWLTVNIILLAFAAHLTQRVVNAPFSSGWVSFSGQKSLSDARLFLAAQLCREVAVLQPQRRTLALWCNTRGVGHAVSECEPEAKRATHRSADLITQRSRSGVAFDYFPCGDPVSVFDERVGALQGEGPRSWPT